MHFSQRTVSYKIYGSRGGFTIEFSNHTNNAVRIAHTQLQQFLSALAGYYDHLRLRSVVVLVAPRQPTSIHDYVNGRDIPIFDTCCINNEPF